MAGTIERTLALKLIGEVQGLKPATKGLGKFTKGLISWGKAMSGAVVLGAIQGIGDALGEAYKGFKSGERVSKQLGKTWRNLGKEGDRLDHWIGKISENTLKLGTSDDDAIMSFNRLVQATGNAGEAYKRYQIAQDLVSNGSAPNLAAAEKLIAQAAKGSARVVDRFGLSSKTAAGRVDELASRVKGAAKTAARAEPFRVLINGLSEDLESIVGAFSQGDFKGFIEGIKGIGETIQDALFGGAGSDGKRNSKKAGLVNQFGTWGRQMAEGMLTAIGEVDWGTELSNIVNTAVGAVATAADNGTLTNLAVLGAAIAGSIFAVDLFITAAKAAFALPVWAAKSAVGLAVSAVGLALNGVLRGAMFIGETAIGLLLSAGKQAFGLALWGAKSVVGVAVTAVGAALGLALRGAMFAADLFISGAAAALRAVGVSGLVTGAAARAGAAIGIAVRTPMLAALGPIGAAVLAGLSLDQFLTSIGWGNSNAGKETLDRIYDRMGWERPGHALGTAGSPGGWRWVGERGPELMRVRTGAQIMNARASSRAVGGGSTVVVPINVNAPIGADGARVGQDIARYLDQWFARGGRFRYRPVGGNA